MGHEHFSLTGKTAVVTGGGRGIGKSIALALAAAGSGAPG
jgi:NAD(P)-dependent dehydrogenase (short-subunit alcohol dehydrogenase family)